jgi:hypothetical protein
MMVLEHESVNHPAILNEWEGCRGNATDCFFGIVMKI